MRDYLSKIKMLCDQLASAGHKISDYEQILSILNGLDEEYEAVAAVISSKETTPTIQYVHATLLAHEGRIEQKKSTGSDFTANFISNSRNRNQGKNNNIRNQSNSQRGGQTNRARGRGGRQYNNNNRIRC